MHCGDALAGVRAKDAYRVPNEAILVRDRRGEVQGLQPGTVAHSADVGANGDGERGDWVVPVLTRPGGEAV